MSTFELFILSSLCRSSSCSFEYVLGLNFSDIRALVQQQQQIIVAYDNYYKASIQVLDDAEAQRIAEEEADAAAPASSFKLNDLNPFD